MLTITISNKYDFSSKDYSTIQPRTTISGTFVKDSSTGYQFTYQQFYVDRFGIQRQVGGDTIIGAENINLTASTWVIPSINLQDGANIIKVKVLGIQSGDEDTDTVTVTYVPQAKIGIRIDPPTGISAEQFTDKVVIKWLGNSKNVFTEKELAFQGTDEIILAKEGAVDLSTLLVSSAEEVIVERDTYQIDIDYVVVQPENVNLPTYIYKTPDSRILDGQTVLASFQVSEAIEQLKGFNIYASSEPAGGTSGYTKLNSRLITTPIGLKELVTSSSSAQTLVNGIRTTTLSERVISLNEYSYEVSEVTLVDAISRLSTDLTTYFVLTAVAADSVARSELESVFSIELVAKPFEITNQVQEFTPRSFDEIVADYIASSLSSQPLLDVKPTSVTRDVHIDPVANELEKAYVMLDFVNKSQSFLTLLALDDPENTGSSASDTEYKTTLQLVFGFDTQAQTQAFIDSQFDKLASNVNVTRKGAESARGLVTLFALNIPGSALVVTPATSFIAPLETGSIKFNSLVSLVIEPEDFPSYFNAATRRYEIKISAIADVAGSASNVDAGAITQTSITNFFVNNENPFLYGSDQESNRSLAERSLVALMGVDYGTVGGYIKEVTSNPGVIKVASQSAGDPFMFRDYDVFRERHIGGKVDLYVQGTRPVVYQEEFGVKFTKVEDERGTVTEDSSFVIFANRDIENLVSVARRDTNGQIRFYDLEYAQLNGKSIMLNPYSQMNSTLGINKSDTILVSYYYAEDLSYDFKHRPVKSIISVAGSTNNTLPSGSYVLENRDDIFQYGNSSQAQSRLRLTQDVVNLGIESNSEDLTFSGTVPVTLSRYGVDLSSISVKSGSVSYTLGTDYVVVESGSTTVKPTIARTTSGSIVNGFTANVSYKASETFAVQYQVENIIESIQDSLEKKEYATADVLVKQANEVPLEISADIILQKGISQSEVDLRIRTALGRYFGNLRLGDSVYQSDIIRIIDEVSGVYAVDLPLLKMSRASNSFVLGEAISVTGSQNITAETFGQTKLLVTYSFPTIAGGGISYNGNIRPVGVYIGSRYFNGIQDISDVKLNKDSCFISANSIDLSSLSSQDIISILAGDIKVIANYYTFDSLGADDIRINVFEHATLADSLFSYRYRS